MPQPQSHGLPRLILAAAFLVGCNLLATIALRFGELPVVSLLRYAGVIFAVLLQVAV